MERNRPSWAISPAISTIMVFGFGLVFSFLHTTVYLPITNQLDRLEKQVQELKSDPTPKPETKVALDGLVARMDRLERAYDKISEQISDLHLLIMQNCRVDMPPILRKKTGAVCDDQRIFSVEANQ